MSLRTTFPWDFQIFLGKVHHWILYEVHVLCISFFVFLQVQYIHQLAQSRLFTEECPLVDLYNCLRILSKYCPRLLIVLPFYYSNIKVTSYIWRRRCSCLKLHSSIFQSRSSSKTKMINGLKFKTIVIARTTLPFYNWHHPPIYSI